MLGGFSFSVIVDICTEKIQNDTRLQVVSKFQPFFSESFPLLHVDNKGTCGVVKEQCFKFVM